MKAVFLLLFVNALVSELWPSAAISIFSVLVFLYFIKLLLDRHVVALALIAPYLIGNLASLVSSVFIDLGAYMPEIGQVGVPTSAASSYAFYNALMFYVAARCIDWFSARMRIHPRHASGSWSSLKDLFAIVVALIGLAYLVLKGLAGGFPLLMGMDRFVYRSQYADIITLNLLNLKFLIAAMLGVAAIDLRNLVLRLGCVLLLLLYVGCYFLYGDKFFTIITFVTFFAAPFLIIYQEKAHKILLSLAPAAAVIVAAMFMVTLYIYSDFGVESLDTAVIRLGERMAGQNQLWFVFVLREGEFFTFRPDLIFENLLSTLEKDWSRYVFDHRLTTFYFADRYAPFLLIDSMNRNLGSTTLTGAYEAYNGVIFGYFGLFFVMIATGLFMGITAVWFVRCVHRRDPLLVLAPTALTIQIWFMTNQGTIASVLSLGSFKVVLALWIAGLIPRILELTLAGRNRRRLPPQRSVRAPMTSKM